MLIIIIDQDDDDEEEHDSDNIDGFTLFHSYFLYNFTLFP